LTLSQVGAIEMLAGKFRIKFDRAGRCTVPSKLRKGLGDEIVVTAGLGECECLTVYSMEEWEQLRQNLFAGPRPRNFREDVLHTMRYLSTNAEVVELDQNNRVVISADLRERAGIQQEAMMVGVMGHAEIWDAERWQAYERQLMTAESQRMIRSVLIEEKGGPA
jgi:MraZ protein